MHTDKFIKFLNENNLQSFLKTHSKYFKYILDEIIKAKKEKIILITDYGKKDYMIAPLLTSAYYEAANKLGIKTEILTQPIKEQGDPIDKEIMKHLVLDVKPENIIIVNVSNYLGSMMGIERDFRKFCYQKKHRFISTTGLGSIRTADLFRITDSLNIDYKKLMKESKKLKRKMDWAREVHIKTKAGTDIKFDLTSRKAISLDGDYYSQKGRGGNIPLGEVYIAPLENKTEGKVVIDVSSRNKFGTVLAKKPIKLTVRKGMVIDIQGNDEADLLKQTLEFKKQKAKYPSKLRIIGELGIGLNPRITPIGCMILDEKAIDTAHIALGNNFNFGGTNYVSSHLDQVFKNPEVFIDGERYDLPSRLDLL